MARMRCNEFAALAAVALTMLLRPVLAQYVQARADRGLLDQRLIFRDGLQPRQPGGAGADGPYEVVRQLFLPLYSHLYSFRDVW